MFRETLAEGEEGALHLALKRPRDNVKMLLEGSELTKEDHESQLYDDFEHFRQHKGETIHAYYVRFVKLINDVRNIKMTMSKMHLNSKFVNNMLPEWGRFVTAVKLNRGLRDSNYDQLYAYLKQHEAHANENKMMLDRFTQHTVDPLALMSNASPQPVDKIEVRGTMYAVQVHLVIGELRIELGMQKGRLSATTTMENGVVLDEEQLLFIAANDCDAFDSDVDEVSTAQTMFMANLSFENPVNNEANPSYDSDILSEIHNHDYYQDAVCDHHEVYEMHDNYVKNKAVPVVQSNVSSVPNDAYMIILNDMHEQPAQHIYVTTQSNVVDKSLAAELATYKEQVELYERRAKFELTEREQKIDEQLRIVITDRNIKEENLKNKLNSLKMQLSSTINHNKSMVEEVTSLKKDFKQKENKYFEEFLDMKALKEKNKVAIGYKNPIYLTRAQQDLIKMKAEALKEQTIASKPIKALMVKHDKIERKNLLIANDNLIADCVSKDVFYTATDSLLTVFRFSDMHEALRAAKKRIAELESENFNLQNKIQNYDHDVMIQSRGNTVHALREKISQLTKKHYDVVPIHDLKALDSQNKELHTKVNAFYDLNECRYAIYIKPIPPYIRNNREVHLDYLKHLKESVGTLCEIVEEAKAERPLDRSLASACLYTKYSQELLEYVICICPKDFNQREKKHVVTPVTRKKQVTFIDPYETFTNNTLTHVKCGDQLRSLVDPNLIDLSSLLKLSHLG
nr:integrase, catalytic region, zinc finger, CCHC-type, peptidase aspartic, catalytic [Tanacetum cinerariifolium]